ncbi:hypothetical protein MKX03_008975 [Papaver bracteatum]|nr:hypothetical protein MKX03_008975 [Papaver bracteatum]
MGLGTSQHHNCVLSELEIKPRYSLFGGWKATVLIGYGLQLEDFLFLSAHGKGYLNFSFECPLVNTVVEKLTMKVVLPEGSKYSSVIVPFPIEEHLETPLCGLLGVPLSNGVISQSIQTVSPLSKTTREWMGNLFQPPRHLHLIQKVMTNQLRL